MSSSAPYKTLSEKDDHSGSESEGDEPTWIASALQTGRRIGVQGAGFFSDAYDLFIINIVISIINKEMPLHSYQKSIISSAALIGAVLGQLIFGFLADFIGRRLGFIMTLCIIILGAALSAVSPPIPMHHNTKLLIALCLFRGILGFGIGGEYPLSATITSEQAPTKNRGRMIAAVFSMQGLGSLTASVVALILLKTIHDLETVWRLCLGLGVIPGLLSMYFRIKMHETKAFKKAEKTKENRRSYFRALGVYWVRLTGTAGGWYLLDVVFYANSLFSSTIIAIFGVGKGQDPRHALADVAQWNVYLSLMALPGYWAAVYLIEKRWCGRRNLQLIGFAALVILYAIIAAAYDKLHGAPAAFLVLYGLTFFFSNAGANTTTFILPSELFPTYVRATFHGISAAAGKLGAITGAYSIAYVAPTNPRLVFILCSSIALLGLFVTWLCIEETCARPLDEINREPSRKKFSWYRGVYLVSEGANEDEGNRLAPVQA